MLEKIQHKHILIDGDIVKYRCAASAEKTKYLVIDGFNEIHYRDTHKEAESIAEDFNGCPIWSRKEVQPVEFALQACKTTIDALLDKLKPSKVSIFLSPEHNFRDKLWVTKPYKGNRTQPKPKHLKSVEEYLVHEYKAVFGDNVEADDEIGRALSGNDMAVSVSIDKDLLQIPGWHYNWVDDRIRWISEKEGDFSFYTQMLTGDVTDNIPGIHGIGPGKAEKILTGARSRAELSSRVWCIYRGEFTDSNAARKYYLEQAELLWILRTRGEGTGYSGGYIVPDGVKLQ